jgi:hypothetical protein
MADTALFAGCPHCGSGWPSRSEFLSRAEFELVGYSPDLGDPGRGRLHFVHTHADCGGPFTLPAGLFLGLLEGPLPPAVRHREPTCSGRCDDAFCLEPCWNECMQAPVRRLVCKLAETALVRGLLAEPVC